MTNLSCTNLEDFGKVERKPQVPVCRHTTGTDFISQPPTPKPKPNLLCSASRRLLGKEAGDHQKKKKNTKSSGDALLCLETAKRRSAGTLPSGAKGDG